MGFETSIALIGAVVDFKATGVTTLGVLEVPGGDVDTDMYACPFLVALATKTGESLLTLPIFTVGFNDPDWNNLLGSTTLTGGAASGSQSVYLTKPGGEYPGSGTPVKIKITTAATTAGASAIAIKVMVLAFPFTRIG